MCIRDRLYLILGFFNILFAWLGLLCFAIPLIMATAGKDKGYCLSLIHIYLSPVGDEHPLQHG